MRPHRRHNAGFTMVEIMVAASVLVIAVALAIHGFSFVCRGSQQEERQDELDIEVQTAMERVKADLRLSSLSKMFFYPIGSGPYTAISFPLSRDDDGDGAIDLDADGKIIWDKTVVYHVWTTAPHQLRCTTFDPRDDAIEDAQRQAQLESVVVKGSGEATHNGANAKTHVVFENLFQWEITPRGSTFDAYADSLSRALDVPLGTVILTPGAHKFQFKVVDKNAASSGYRVGLDSLFVSPCGEPREAEEQLPVVTQYGATASKVYMAAGSWDANHHLYFPASAKGCYLTLAMDNDRWEETNFASGHEQYDSTTLLYDTGIGSGDYVVKLKGLGTNWSASAQTGNAGASSGHDELTDTAVRVVVRGGYAESGGWLKCDGGQCAVNFRAGDATKPLRIRGATIATCVSRDSNSADAVTNSVRVLTFGGALSTVIPGGGSAWSDLVPYPIEEEETYLITFLAGVGMSDASAWKWTETLDPTAIGCYIRPGGDLWDVASATWSTKSGVVPTNCVYAVGHLFTAYPLKGTITSRILDTGLDAADFSAVDWTAIVPSGAALTLKVRSGNNNNLSDATAWTNIVAMASPGAIDPGDKRYVQFQAELRPDAGGGQTPTLQDVTVKWNGQTRVVEVGGTFTRGPDYGVFEVLVDGRPLKTGISIDLEIFDETRGFAGDRRITSELTTEVWPRNTGK